VFETNLENLKAKKKKGELICTVLHGKRGEARKVQSGDGEEEEENIIVPTSEDSFMQNSVTNLFIYSFHSPSLFFRKPGLYIPILSFF
jgi:hypothetical protein